MSYELVERNNNIFYRKHIDKKSYKEIASEFGISETRVRQVLYHVRQQRKFENLPTNQHIDELDRACEFYKADKTLRGRVYNTLAQHGYLKRKRWLHLTEQRLLDIPNLGVESVKIILKAQDYARF